MGEQIDFKESRGIVADGQRQWKEEHGLESVLVYEERKLGMPSLTTALDLFLWRFEAMVQPIMNHLSNKKTNRKTV